jgi:hypothetical protein
MQIFEAILSAATTYHGEWRNPRLAPLGYSAVYAHFPE